MNWRAKSVFSIGLLGLLGLLCLMLPGSLRADTLNFDSINTNTSPFYVDISTTNYLAQYGITLANVTAGTTVDVLCANASYNTSCSSGTGAIFAPSAPNVLMQQGYLQGESYTLAFSNPLSTLSFDLAGANFSNLFAAWSVTAYNASNGVLSSVGNPSLSVQSSTVQSYTLAGPGIAYATFFSNCEGICGEQLAIDNLSSPDLHLVTTPEPSSLLLLCTGILGLLALAARSKRHATPTSC